MLESIHIENIALIKNINISFDKGFSAFTGETGAGKSIIIDSISIINGARAQKELIRSGEENALVEAIFSGLSKQSVDRLNDLGFSTDEDGYLYISRSLSADGKSVSRINSRQVPTSVLREISAFLINIHGQHDNQDLLKKEKHLGILDLYKDISKEYNEYTGLYAEYKSLKREYESICTDDSEKLRTAEMLKFQIEEIEAMKLKADEEEKLTAEKKRLSNIEKITENAYTAYGVLFGNNLSAAENIDKALSCLYNLSKMEDGIDVYIDRLEKARSEVYDIAESIKDVAGETEDNPSAVLDRIEQRLYDIYKLKRKYGHTIPDILEYLEKSKQKLSDLELSDIRAKELEAKLDIVKDKLNSAALSLTNARKDAAAGLKAEIEAEFEYLEMPKVKFETSFSEKPFSNDGIDDIEFLVKTNTGLPFMPLSKTASGGELSRIMLAIKSVLAKKDGVETVIYDEIDTGISGKTSRRIGIKLKQTSKTSQVMCVTHSAQIASIADSHYLVSKNDSSGTTVSEVKLLDENERIDETARIIAGIDITENAKNAALELINESKNY